MAEPRDGSEARMLLLPDDNLLIACPECGRDHEWKPQDAVVDSG